MFQEYLAVIAQGIPTSLLLTVVALFIAFFLALGLTFLLSIGNKLVKSAVNLFLVLFTGTPLLVQFFLIYAVLVNSNGWWTAHYGDYSPTHGSVQH